jgi:hypothetical protein
MNITGHVFHFAIGPISTLIHKRIPNKIIWAYNLAGTLIHKRIPNKIIWAYNLAGTLIHKGVFDTQRNNKKLK